MDINNQPLHIQVLVAKGRLCDCGHSGEDHAGTEPRVCKVCYNCYAFHTQNAYADMLSKIDIFVAQFHTWAERIDWICKNMPFVLGLNNTQFIFWYWKFVYPKWNPEEEFMYEDTKKAIELEAKPEAITRAFRLYKENNPHEVEKFKNLRMWQKYNEAGYREAAITSKS